ncbi:MAG TPA: hypothetical protein VGA09_00865, partial [Candidatus Binatia bacterium]
HQFGGPRQASRMGYEDSFDTALHILNSYRSATFKLFLYAFHISLAPIAHTSRLIVSPLLQLTTSEPLLNLALGQGEKKTGAGATSK